ncbi:ZIP family metal transporter [Clostridium botulinum]|uniref:ZIP family metal transporter n=1 Tax=Clostridium botulinum TaxID=1491 RepID=UPI000C791C8F|nr:ZIP family metal transporter [Clostridium botulinum]AUN24953.1 ZIP family metal transporter [Clostridium botulinum]
MTWFKELNPIMQALLATLFTWAVTALGASLVFFFKNINKKVLNAMLGFAAGVMIAASYWSLLAPAIEMAESQGKIAWIPAAVGFLAGGIFLRIVDRILPHLHLGKDRDEAEGIKTSWQKSILLVLAITLHNIPEGLAVGVAFGAVGANIESAYLAGAIALALGIGIQNFPEGAAVSIPLRREGNSRLKSFWYGQASGIVEPIAGVIGAAAVLFIRNLLPYALSFAAGAMIFVVVEELIPEAQEGKDTDISSIGVLIGFTVMMILDVALG